MKYDFQPRKGKKAPEIDYVSERSFKPSSLSKTKFMNVFSIRLRVFDSENYFLNHASDTRSNKTLQ